MTYGMPLVLPSIWPKNACLNGKMNGAAVGFAVLFDLPVSSGSASLLQTPFVRRLPSFRNDIITKVNL